MERGNALTFVRSANPTSDVLWQLVSYSSSCDILSNVILNAFQVLDIARGLEYLHSNNTIHSDLKPVSMIPSDGIVTQTPLQENIVVGPGGRAMICNFGCARIEKATQSLAAPTSMLKGTCHYWAPELLRSGKMSKESDVWAFGMTIYVSNRPYCFPRLIS